MSGTGAGPGRGWRQRGRQPRARQTVLRRLNRWQAEQQREDLADLYLECSAVEPGEEYARREDFVERLVSDARHPGFDMLVAETATLVGFVFGVPVDRDGSWWDGFVGQLPGEVEQLTASGHVFALTELVVHPYVRGHGVAGQLQARLLGDHQASLGTTLVQQADHAAYAAFQSWGWQEIGEVHRAPDAVVLRALVLQLGARTKASPGGLTHNTHTQRPDVS